MTSKQQLGLRIRAVREKLKLNQSEFGQQLGISNTTVSNYENGDIYPSLDILIKIAQTGGVTYDWLIDGYPLPQDEQHEITVAETRLLWAYRALSPESRELVTKIAEAIASGHK